MIKGTLSNFEDTSEFIILGDLQSCPNLPVERALNQQNSLSKYLDQFIYDCNLTPIDITEGTGPNYTYQHISLPNRSYIDHILVSVNLIKHTCQTEVLNPHCLNSGDHLPVKSHINFIDPIAKNPSGQTSSQSDNSFVPNHMWKNPIFIDLYQQSVIDALDTSLNHESMESEIHYLQKTLIQSAQNAYDTLNSNSKFHTITPKSWWNKELSKCRKILQSMFNTWKSEGFSKDPENIAYNRYLFARKQFRSLNKKCKNQATAHHFVNIEKIKKMKPSSYWNQIRLAKKDTRKLYTINGKTEIKDISQDFKNHFNNLLNTPRTSSTNNETSNKRLKDLLTDMNGLQDPNFEITGTEVSNAIKQINLDKSPDPFGVKVEHFFHVNETVSLYLADIINKIFKNDSIPPLLATSLIIPIVKSYKKSMQDPNNYRGISITPIITKIIERIIINKCPKLQHHNDMQFGFVSNASTLHAELLLSETVKRYNQGGSPVYVCSLDAEKAFDSLTWYNLFSRLKSDSILPKVVIRFLINLYMQGTSKVLYNGFKTDQFHLSQGVRQGSLLSPYLYNFYTKDLILHIQQLKIGTFLPGSINTSIVVYADDIILISPTLKHLQLMVQSCERFGEVNGLKFNSSSGKTQFIISGNSPLVNPQIMLNEELVNPVSQLKHLGFIWGTSSRKKITLQNHIDNRISELWSTISSLISCGVRKMHPNTIVSIFKSIVLPKVLYGLELTEMNGTLLDKLDRQCRVAFKSMLGISKHSLNHLHKLYNVNVVSNELNNRKINLLQRLIRNKLTRKYVFALLKEENKAGSCVMNLFNICKMKDINLMDILLQSKISYRKSIPNDLDDHTYRLLTDMISNWHLYANRKALKEYLESAIPH